MTRLAQILTLSIFFAIAGQQISVAQELDFSFETEGDRAKKELAEKKKENARKDSIIAEIDKENAAKKKRNVELKKERAELDKELARLKAQKKSQQNKDAKKENN